ncbi:MAG: homoserine dehydrogenase [Ruminococcaceae bacterium]|nr:homoserine dehydrogenase [Oscillospiraceae bacterium]
MRIGLLGFGTVGSHFYQLAAQQSDIQVVAVLSRRPRPELDCRVTADFSELLADPTIDIIAEAIGGDRPAFDYISAALRAGKHVATANKQVMCAHYDELLALSTASGTALRCTAAAGGGIPWLTSLARAAVVDEIVSVDGIVNGTTNFILSAMTEQGADFADTLVRAQTLGFAEADPTADIEGLDARRKLVLSADLAFGISLRESDIPCVGISSVTAGDIEMARQQGSVWKLIARAERRGDRVAAWVCPTLFPAGAPEACTGGTGNLISLCGRRIGRQSFSGAGAGGFPTASNLLADCRAIMGGARGYYTDTARPCAVDNGAVSGRWLFRAGGVYQTAEDTVADAFARYAALRREDPTAVLARIADPT